MLRRILIAQMTKLLLPNFETTRNATPPVTDRIPFFRRVDESTKYRLKYSYIVQMLFGFDTDTLEEEVTLFGLKFVIRYPEGGIVMIHEDVALGGPASTEDPIHSTPRGHRTKSFPQRYFPTGSLLHLVRSSESGLYTAPPIDIDAIASGSLPQRPLHEDLLVHEGFMHRDTVRGCELLRHERQIGHAIAFFLPSVVIVRVLFVKVNVVRAAE
mmetsp:Transcript_25660/g.46459  ORF Transcript_25660/g.46459 Transcript_25660/m.46459 type:complete len:213 (-) Transcript_25660:343-981(-)